MFGRGLTGQLTDEAAVAQRVYAALKLVRGTWFYDTTQGVAWMRQTAGAQTVLEQAYDPEFANAELKRVILSVEGVAAIKEFAFTLDRTTRVAEVSALVQTIFGTVEPVIARFEK